MSYIPSPQVSSSTPPFSQSTCSSATTEAQFDTHTASWISGTVLSGSGWLQGSIYTNTSGVICPTGLTSSVGDTRDYWANTISYGNVNRCFCDDAWVGFSSSIAYQAHDTKFNNLSPVVDTSRTRANVVRFFL